jgi:multiple sugar transport system permease protein
MTSFRRSSRRRDYATALFVAPWTLTLGVFWLYPLGYALYLSFTKYYTLRNEAVFIGLDNYAHILGDSFFWQALGNTALFTAGSVSGATIIALGLALAAHSLPRFGAFFRAALFAPSVTSLVVLALIFSNLYAADGYLSFLCASLSLPFPERGWLQEPLSALPSLVAMDIAMTSGYYMTLLLAGLQTIPRDLYEAAEISGATKTRQFFSITLPLLRPILLFVVAINSIRSLQIFVEIYVMTRGGPLGATTTLMYSVFVNAFEKSDMMGYACALAFISLALILLFALLQFRLFRSDAFSSGGDGGAS